VILNDIFGGFTIKIIEKKLKNIENILITMISYLHEIGKYFLELWINVEIHERFIIL
jgi:hypothetical protein